MLSDSDMQTGPSKRQQISQSLFMPGEAVNLLAGRTLLANVATKMRAVSTPLKERPAFFSQPHSAIDAIVAAFSMDTRSEVR